MYEIELYTEDIMNDNKDTFFTEEEDGILLPERNHTSQEELERLIKNISKKFLITDLGIVKKITIKGICYDKEGEEEVPVSLNYQLVTDDLVWDCSDFRKDVLKLALEEGSPFKNAINLALSKVAKYTAFGEYSINDPSNKINKDFSHVKLDDLILRKNFANIKNKPPMEVGENEENDSVCVQKIFSEEATPVILQLEAPKCSSNSFISTMLPDNSEPSVFEGFFQKR